MKLAKGGIKRLITFLRDKKALSTLVIMILMLDMIIAASVAWFTLNRKTDADEMGMALAVDDTQATYKAYMYDLETKMGTDKARNEDGTPMLDENGNPVFLDVTNIDLNQYDTIFKAQNKYTPAFAKIEIVRNESMAKNGTVTITIDRISSDETNAELSAFSSSILRFTAFIIEDKSDVAITDPEALYDLINTKERFDEIEEYKYNDDAQRPFSKTFVSVVGEGEGHTHSKSDSITITVDYTEDMWYEVGEGENKDETLNVYLYMTYDVQLIECYMDEHSGGGISLDDNSVFFENDMKKITVGYINKEN
jgi:hypothetical protein